MRDLKTVKKYTKLIKEAYEKKDAIALFEVIKEYNFLMYLSPENFDPEDIEIIKDPRYIHLVLQSDEVTALLQG